MKFKNTLLGGLLVLTIGALKGDDLVIGENGLGSEGDGSVSEGTDLGEPIDTGTITEGGLELGGVVLGTPAVAGTGCAAGSVFMYLEAPTQEVVVFFDNYFVEAGGHTRIARKNCALSIPLHLPAGLQVALITTRYEGFNILPDGGSTVLSSESFLAGSTGERTTETFEGETDEDFVVEAPAAIGAESMSGCGGNVNLRINSSLRVKTNANGDSALAAITALGVNGSGLVQQLKFSKCE